MIPGFNSKDIKFFIHQERLKTLEWVKSNMTRVSFNTKGMSNDPQ